MKIIDIDILDPKSIGRAVRELERYADKLEESEGRIAEAVAEVGVKVVSDIFASAPYAGTKDILVRVESEGKEAEVLATGESVAFLEFGTGVVMGQGPTLPRPDGIVGLGQYGKGKGATPPWGYYGFEGDNPPEGTYYNEKKDVVITHGNPPAGALMRASIEMESQAEEIVRKELGKL